MRAACEQIGGCWAGVEVNFGPLLYAAQHANEKNRGSICMLCWSCSNNRDLVARFCFGCRLLWLLADRDFLLYHFFLLMKHG